MLRFISFCGDLPTICILSDPVQIKESREKDMKNNPGERWNEKRRRIPLFAMILMIIGLLTVLYFLITYALMPLLALMTVS